MPGLKWLNAVRLFALAAALVAGGCGAKTTEPKLELTEEEKRQVQELHEQRLDEWGKRK